MLRIDRFDMGYEVVAEEIEVASHLRAAALGAAEDLAIETPRGGEVGDRHRKVEGIYLSCLV
jgi:hypothetical protein